MAVKRIPAKDDLELAEKLLAREKAAMAYPGHDRLVRSLESRIMILKKRTKEEVEYAGGADQEAGD